MYKTTNDPERPVDAIVVGGGLAGLTAAAVAAKSGYSVMVLEQARELGGRAMTNVRDSVHFNLGPRALFRSGHALQVLRQLGVPLRGAVPNPGKSVVTCSGRRYALPVGTGSLIASRLLGLADKLRLAKFLRIVARINPRSVDHLTADEWVRRTIGGGHVSQLLHAFLRVSTYANDPRHLSAGAALGQLQLALAGNVLYLDGGWQSLVDALHNIATGHGAVIRAGARVESVGCTEGFVNVALMDGTSFSARSAIIAADPQTAIRLLALPSDHPLTNWSQSARPARAACLDVALSQLPRPNERFALGLDQPTYFSVHSSAAKLAPEGIAVVHAMQYLGPEPRDSAAVNERELETFLDAVQPGWRQHVRVRRFLPNMVVTHGIPLASQGGAAGRPGAEVADRPRVFLAGEWVGRDGQLADAAVASADFAARHAVNVGRHPTSEASCIHAGR
jgi:phytoene dehydrogenase-like protein